MSSGLTSFEYYFPKTNTVNDTQGAKNLRSATTLLMAGHLGCAILAIAFISSVITFIGQFIYIAILYSIFSALHTWLIYTYCAIAVINSVMGLFTLIGYLIEPLNLLFYAIIVIFYLYGANKLFNDSALFRSAQAGNIATALIDKGVNNAKVNINNKINKPKEGGAVSAPAKPQADIENR